MTERVLALIVSLVLVASRAQAQTAQVIYTYNVGPAPAASVTLYTATLYVNGTPFPLNDTCTLAGVTIECVAPLPNIATALTPVGPQQFEVSFKDGILEGPKSIPLVLLRPSAPGNLRIQ